MDNYIHPCAMQFYDQFASMFGPRLGGLQLSKVFVTRAFLGQGHLRGNFCANEVEIAQVAANEFGFCVIAPETLPLGEQIRIFANIKTLAGVYGSGLHTAIFSQPGTRVGAVGPVNSLQSIIAIAREQRMIYMGMEPNAMPYVDLDKFRFFLERLVHPETENHEFRYILKPSNLDINRHSEIINRFNHAPVLQTDHFLLPGRNIGDLPGNLLVHRSAYGDSVTGTAMTCTSLGIDKTIEGFAIFLKNISEGELLYQNMNSGGEWSNWIPSPSFAGTCGLSESLSGFSIDLRGDLADKYICRYAGVFGKDNRLILCDEGQRCFVDKEIPMHAMQIIFLRR